MELKIFGQTDGGLVSLYIVVGSEDRFLMSNISSSSAAPDKAIYSASAVDRATRLFLASPAHCGAFNLIHVSTLRLAVITITTPVHIGASNKRTALSFGVEKAKPNSFPEVSENTFYCYPMLCGWIGTQKKRHFTAKAMSGHVRVDR